MFELHHQSLFPIVTFNGYFFVTDVFLSLYLMRFYITMITVYKNMIGDLDNSLLIDSSY